MTLDERVALLEKNSRLWRTAAITLGLALFTVAFTSCSGEPAKSAATTGIPDVIQARRFEVVAVGGLKLVELGATEDGKGRVVTYNENGKEMVELGSFEGTGTVSTINENGNSVVTLSSSDGEGVVGIWNGRGDTKMVLP